MDLVIHNIKPQDILSAVREANDLSQEQMSEKLDVSRSHYQNMENGKADIDLDKLETLSELFDIEINIGKK